MFERYFYTLYIYKKKKSCRTMRKHEPPIKVLAIREAIND